MNLNDNIPLRGDFHLELFRGGKLVETIDEPNLIVSLARTQLAHLIAGDVANRHITHIGFGIGTAAASPNNTGLTGAFFKPVTSVSYPDVGKAAFAWTLSTAEANGLAITEFGLRCADNTLFARKARAAIQKDADLSLSGTWTIIF